VLVCKGYKRWDKDFKVPVIDITDLEKVVERNPPTSLGDIPGLVVRLGGLIDPDPQVRCGEGRD
jgi:hypothetical protein